MKCPPFAVLLPPLLLLLQVLQLESQVEAKSLAIEIPQSKLEASLDRNLSSDSNPFQYKTLEANVMMNCSLDEDCLNFLDKADTLEIELNEAELNKEEKERSFVLMNWIYVSTGSAVACLFLISVVLIKLLFKDKAPVTPNPPVQIPDDFYVEDDLQPARIMVY